MAIVIETRPKISFWSALKLRLAEGKAIDGSVAERTDEKIDEKIDEKKEGLSRNLISGRHRICAEIAKSLGIKHCRWLQIDMHVDEVVTVKAEFFPEVDEIMQVDTIFKQYELELVEKEETKDEEDQKQK